MTKILYKYLAYISSFDKHDFKKAFRTFPIFCLYFCISFFRNAHAHIQYTSFSCLHNFPNLKNCLVLRLQSFVYSTLYSSIRKILKIIIIKELLIYKSLFVSKARPQLKLRTNQVVTK